MTIHHYDPVQPDKQHAWGHLTWMVTGKSDVASMTVGRVVIKPGQANPRHRHQRCDEVLHLLAGELEHSVGARTVRLRAGDTLCIPAGVFHHAAALGDTPADMVVCFSSGDRDFELET